MFGWKRFNSANAASNVPTLTTSYDACVLYGGYRVCAAIRAKYEALGGRPATSGSPPSTRRPYRAGFYQHFAGGSIYYSGPTGPHTIQGAIRREWGAAGYERGYLGYPRSDEYPVPAAGRTTSPVARSATTPSL